MTIEQQKPDAIAKLEAAVKDAQGALDAFNEAHNYRYAQSGSAAWATTVEQSKLANVVETTKRTLNEARNVAHNESIYQELLTGYAANSAKNAAEKVAKEAQQRGENEAALKTQAQNVYYQHGGSALEFARAWPTMREKLLEQKTMDTLKQSASVDLVDQYIQKRNRASS
jgi:hypothetical protein